MDDVISRQQAIDALCNDYCGGHQDCKYYPNCENLKSIEKLPSAQPEVLACGSGELVQESDGLVKDLVKESISRQQAIDAMCDACSDWCDEGVCKKVSAIQKLPSAQPEDYAELKREFLRMASYIDVLLECSDEQKETLIGFISRLAEFMPWTERD